MVKSLNHILSQFLSGFYAMPRGMRWLFKYPNHLLLLIGPFLFGVVTLFSLFYFFYTKFKVDLARLAYSITAINVEGTGIYEIIYTLMFLFFSSIVMYVVVSILAAPFYEIVSAAIERQRFGKLTERLTFWRSMRLFSEEMKKALFTLVMIVLVMIAPGVNLFSLLVSAFFIAWDFCDYPLVRRGWTFRKRLEFAATQFPAYVGFGMWLIIPFFSFFVMPFAVVGGTLLTLDALKKRRMTQCLD